MSSYHRIKTCVKQKNTEHRKQYLVNTDNE